jgi:hypothetical protein
MNGYKCETWRAIHAEFQENLVSKLLSVTIIQFNSILYYLCAESTASNPITDTAQCRYIMDKHNIKLKINYSKLPEEKHFNLEK